MMMQTFFRRLHNAMRRMRGNYRLQRVEDLPETLRPDIIYAVADAREAPWAAALICPCGCAAVIQLSLVPGGGPSWRLSRDWLRRPALYPSVWRVRGCRSHFWLRRGVVTWVRADL